MKVYTTGILLMILCISSNGLWGQVFNLDKGTDASLIAHSGSTSSVPILLYHSISEGPDDPLKVTPVRFSEQMNYLKNAGYHPLHFKDLQEYWDKGRPLPQKPVIITFDDGYEDNYSEAFPILLNTGIKATVLAVTGSIGTPGRLSWQQLRTMEASGLLDTQSHTVTHTNLTKLDNTDKLKELVDSKEQILKKLGHPAQVVAYPYGFYDQATIDAVRQAGYQYALATEPGSAELGQGRFALYRILITGDMTMDQFMRTLDQS